MLCYICCFFTTCKYSSFGRIISESFQQITLSTGLTHGLPISAGFFLDISEWCLLSEHVNLRYHLICVVFLMKFRLVILQRVMAVCWCNQVRADRCLSAQTSSKALFWGILLPIGRYYLVVPGIRSIFEVANSNKEFCSFHISDGY